MTKKKERKKKEGKKEKKHLFLAFLSEVNEVESRCQL